MSEFGFGSRPSLNEFKFRNLQISKSKYMYHKLTSVAGQLVSMTYVVLYILQDPRVVLGNRWCNCAISMVMHGFYSLSWGSQ
jgi:hypothetical protein